MTISMTGKGVYIYIYPTESDSGPIAGLPYFREIKFMGSEPRFLSGEPGYRVGFRLGGGGGE